MKDAQKVSIRPQVHILSVLKFLEYETWFALAEFVDNAIASYQLYEKDLKVIEGSGYQLEVNIEINQQENKITIRDNAAGIHQKDYLLAFRAAEIPPDTSGLSEFGMGMKSAACWFADEWSVRTTALGESVEKTVRFDMKKIFEDKLEELDVVIRPCNENHHYTIIGLYNVSKIPRRRGLGKVKEHLKSIYREFIRRGDLILKVDNEELRYHDPRVLKVHRYDYPKNEPVLWKKEIDFPIEDRLSVHGFVAIREKASTSQAGFALFRRGRLIEGSYDNGFRPEFIFGNPNSFRYQRVFGELHLEGFEVRFNKITWKISIELSYDPSLKDLIEIGDHLITEKTSNFSIRQIGIRLSLTHLFMVQFVGVDNSKIEPVLRIVAALGLSEVIAKESGSKTQGEVRRNFNELISCLTKVEQA